MTTNSRRKASERSASKRQRTTNRKGKDKMEDQGILIAIGDGGTFQVICAVISTDEAREMIADYETYGPHANLLAPEYYEIHRRRNDGAYRRIERIEVGEDVPATPLTKQDAIAQAVKAFDKNPGTYNVVRRGRNYAHLPVTCDIPRGWKVAEMIGPGNVANYRTDPSTCSRRKGRS